MNLEFNAFDNICVSKDKVDEYKKKIQERFYTNNILVLSYIKEEILPPLYIENTEEFNNKIPMLKTQINNFIAYENALTALIIEGKILPIADNHNVGRINVYIKDEDNSYINNKFEIPIIPFHAFISVNMQ